MHSAHYTVANIDDIDNCIEGELMINKNKKELSFKTIDGSSLVIRGEGYDSIVSQLNSLFEIDNTPVINGVYTPPIHISDFGFESLLRFETDINVATCESASIDNMTCTLMLHKQGLKPKVVFPI